MASTEETTDVSLVDNPPVLPSSDCDSPPGRRPNSSAEEKTNEEPNASKKDDEEKPLPPVVPGLSEMINEWQIAGTPEEKQFFSAQGNMLEAAVVAIKARLDEQDSNIRQSWLLTEVDHWDLEKERVVILTDSNVISVKYNFIQQQVEELKFIPIKSIAEATFGNFKYPYTYAYQRAGKGLRIYWGGSEQQLGFFTRWNPFSSSVPYTTFASHVIVRRRRVNKPELSITAFPQELERAVNDYRSKMGTPNENQEGAAGVVEFKVADAEISVNHYLGVSAMVHNDSYLGFFKKRGALNW